MDTVRSIVAKQQEQIKSDNKHKMYLYLLDYISKNCKFLEIDLSNNDRLEYLGDFYGLLSYLNTNPRLNYINTLLNGLSSSNEYDGEADKIYILDELDQKITYILNKLNNL